MFIENSQQLKLKVPKERHELKLHSSIHTVHVEKSAELFRKSRCLLAEGECVLIWSREDQNGGRPMVMECFSFE